MKILNLIWRDPSGSIVNEQLDASVFKVEMGQGHLTLKEKNEIVRFIPTYKLEVVQFHEKPDENRIVQPSPAPFPARLPS